LVVDEADSADVSRFDLPVTVALHPLITNIQASWVKLGAEGVMRALQSGVNDLGGTLMNETISRSAGASHGQEMTPAAMQELIQRFGRIPFQRTTLYARAPHERQQAACSAAELSDVVNNPVLRRGDIAGVRRRYPARKNSEATIE
jgi:FO synthase